MGEFRPKESELAHSLIDYPNPLLMTREGFVDFWTEKLTGLGKGEQFDSNNQELIGRMKAARANNAAHEAYLLSLAPTVLQENPERIIDSLLGNIYDKVAKDAAKSGGSAAETPGGLKLEKAKQKIRRDVAAAILENFNKLNNEKVDFAKDLQEMLGRQFPQIGIKVERENSVYKCNVGDLFYLAILFNQRIPMKYEKFYKSAESFSRGVKKNIRPAVGFEVNQELVVVEEGAVEV